MDLPQRPFELAPALDFAPAARRTISVFGAPAELVWLPERQARHGIPSDRRPPFRPTIAARIVAEEALWRGEELVLTPNRFPFAERQLVLWAAQDTREPTPALVTALIELEERSRGTALLNTVGAAASIPRAHGHLVDERLPFLDRLPTRPFTPDYLVARPDLEVARLAPPYPCEVLALRGPAAARAQATHELLAIRTVPTFNMVSSNGTTWLFPRCGAEIPAPHFPHALGSSELWGRWCYGFEADFAAARPPILESALAATGFPRVAE